MKLTEIKQLLRESENDIPMSEWKKVFQYVERGSDFRKVGAACQRNETKIRCRYLILKALGLKRAAYDFIQGANVRWAYEDELDKLPLPEVPAQFQDKTSSVDNYEDQAEEFKKRTMSGPLKELAQMGIKFVQLYPNGKSSRKRDVEIASEVMDGNIPTWRPASTGLEFRNGRRWDVNQSIIMLNGHTKDGYKWFKYTDHTNEGVDSPSYGYDIGGPNDAWVGGSEVSVAWCRKWIRDNIIKDEDVKESKRKPLLTKEQMKRLVNEAKGEVEKFYVIAERYNPQLGLYLMALYIGKKRVNKNSISCSFDYYGSSKTLKFSLGVDKDGKHSCISGDNSIYGSVNYYGFDSVEETKAYLEANWKDSKNFQIFVDKLNQNNLTESANDSMLSGKIFKTTVEDYLDKMFGETLVSIDSEKISDYGYYNEIIDKEFDGDTDEFIGFLYDNRHEPMTVKEWFDPNEGLMQEFELGGKKFSFLISKEVYPGTDFNYWFDGTPIFQEDDVQECVVEEAGKKNSYDLIKKLGTAILNNVDEHNFIHEMRYKAWDVKNVDDISGAAALYWITQEGFDRSDFNKFMKELKRSAAEVLEDGKYKLNGPILFRVTAISRDGPDYGCNTSKFTVG